MKESFEFEFDRWLLKIRQEIIEARRRYYGEDYFL